MPRYHITELLQRSEGLPCKVPGCPRPKLKQHTSYCRKHRQGQYIWGHPDGLAIKLKEYQRYIPAVQKFLEEYPIPALDTIQHFFQNMLYKSSRITTGPARWQFPWLPNMIRTSDKIQNRPDVLVDRLVAMMLYDHHHMAFKNDEHRNRAFAHQTLIYGRIPMNVGATNWRTGKVKQMTPGPKGRLLHALGLGIWQSTGVFWLSIQRAILKEQELKDAWRDALCVPALPVH